MAQPSFGHKIKPREFEYSRGFSFVIRNPWRTPPQASGSFRALRLRQTVVQHLSDGRLQVVDLNRLGDVGVHAGLDGVPHVIHKGVGGHGDDGDAPGLRVGSGADGPRCLVSVHHRHLHVHQDQVVPAGLGGLELLHGFLAVAGGVADSAQAGEDLDQNDPVHLDVVHDQDVLAQDDIGLTDFRLLLTAHDPVDRILEGAHKEGLGHEMIHADLHSLLLDFPPVVGGEQQQLNKLPLS